MENERMSFRWLRTERMIRRAYSQLCEEKDPGRITVTELAARANIGRSTFYQHYPSLDALAGTDIRASISKQEGLRTASEESRSMADAVPDISEKSES